MACSVCSLSGVGAYEIACESTEELGARIPDHYPDTAPTAAEVSGQVPAARADLAQPIAWADCSWQVCLFHGSGSDIRYRGCDHGNHKSMTVIAPRARSQRRNRGRPGWGYGCTVMTIKSPTPTLGAVNPISRFEELHMSTNAADSIACVTMSEIQSAGTHLRSAKRKLASADSLEPLRPCVSRVRICGLRVAVCTSAMSDNRGHWDQRS